MKRFLLFVNPKKEKAPGTAEFVRSFLLSRGASGADIVSDLPEIEALKDYDCLVTFGGDGTIIRAARRVAGSGLPIAGINLGHLGYLTLVSEMSEIPALLCCLISDECYMEERMMLEGSVELSDGSRPMAPQLSLNEIVVSRQNYAGPSIFRVLVNGDFLNEYKADGIIISTPTGSTAYNLSAGGPIVDPAARMTILTPICPHALNRNSIVLKAEDKLEIQIPEHMPGSQSVIFDGAVNLRLNPGGRVLIGESRFRTSLVRIQGGTFLARVRSRLTAL